VCVNSANRDRLLNTDSWPDSVRIAHWFKYRDKSDQVDNEEKRRRISGTPRVSPTRNNHLRKRTDVEPTSAAAAADVACTCGQNDHDSGGDQTT